MNTKQGSKIDQRRRPIGKKLSIAIICLGSIINIIIGLLFHYTGMTHYPTTLATLISATFFGIPIGILVGVISALLEAWLYSPTMIFYIATHVMIVCCIGIVAKKFILQSIFTATIAGILLGVISAFVNASLIAQLSKNICCNTSIATGFLLSGSHCLTLAIFLEHLAIEPWIKIVECLAAFLVFQCLTNGI